MSNTKWFDHMRIAFPDWQVLDSSGNNFSIVRDFSTIEGGQVMIGVAENVAYVLRHKDFGRFVTFAEWDVQNDVDDVAGVERLYDDPALFQSVYLIDERDGELHEVQGGVAGLLNEETQEYIQDIMQEFMVQFIKGGGY